MKRTWFMRIVVLLAVLTMISANVASMVMAKYVKNTEIENDFLPAKSEDPPIEEKFENNVKEDVYFKVNPDNNSTQYPVYFRVALVFTWQKEEEDGSYTVHYTKPVNGTDYQIDLNLDNKNEAGQWIDNVADGYYYYNIPVPSDGQTTFLINRCVQLPDANAPEGYSLNVEIIVQTIQAVGTTDEGDIPAYQDAWDKAPNGFTSVTTP